MNDKGLKILLIEDNAGDVRLIREMLAEVEGMSYNFESAGRLSAGLECLVKQQFDVVLLDLGLPDSQGLKTLNKIYAQTPTTPIVVLTGLGDEVIANQAVREGAQDYLLKGDINGRALWRIIRYAIERKLAEKALHEEKQFAESLIDTAQAIILVLDTAGRIVSFNRYMAEVSGYHLEEVQGRDWFSTFLPEDDQHRIKELFLKAKGGTQTHGNVNAIVTKDGRIRDIEWNDKTLKDENGDTVGLLAIGQDITERKKLTDALVESELWYRHLFDNAPFGIGFSSIDGKVINLNKTMETITGYSVEEYAKINLVDTYVNKADRKEMLQEIRRYGGVTDYLVELKRKDGTRYHALLTIRLTTIGDKEFVQTICHDVTERKRVEKALRQSEERYRSLVETGSAGVVSIDLEGNLTFVNQSLLEQLGYSEEEIIGKSFAGFLHPEDSERVLNIFMEGMANLDLKPKLEFRLMGKDGHSIWYYSAPTSVIISGTLSGSSAILINITERKLVEEALQQSEEKYRSLFEESIDPVFISTREGIIVDINQAMLNLFGYTREELIGTDVRKVYFNPEGRHYFQQKIEQKGFIKDWETRFRKKDGTEVECLLTSVFRWGDKKNILGYQGIIRDISERKLVEAEKNEIEQKAEVASRLASIGEMASGIAHEINNPLTGVIGYAQLLSKKELPEDIREGLEVINDGAQRVAGIIKRLLTFARQYKPERTLVNINNIIETTLNLRAYHLKTSNIKVTTRLAPDLPTTIADAGQLQQVFLNLIVNAEVEMKQAHCKGKLSVRTEQMDNIIRISFKDDGPGIMKKNMERIFNPFFTTRKVGEGTGLGLSVCHGIIAEHGGRIYAESKLGKGATFIVELPMVTADNQLELPELIAEEPQKVTNARILVVDDEPGVRQFLGQALTDEGHEVQTVDNASDALEMIKSQRYSLILLDIKMPDMSGIELYERIHKISQSLAGRVVFITGDVLGINTAAFLSKTKVPHIVKPFDIEQLKKDISRILTEGARGWARQHGKAQV